MKRLGSAPGGWVWCGGAPVLPRPWRSPACVKHLAGVIEFPFALGAARFKPSISAAARRSRRRGAPPSPEPSIVRMPCPALLLIMQQPCGGREAGTSLSSSPACCIGIPAWMSTATPRQTPGQGEDEDDSGGAFALWRRALSLLAALLMNSVFRSTRSAGGAAAAGFVKPSGTNCLGTRQPYKSPLVFFLPSHLVKRVLLCAAAPAQMVLGRSVQGSLSGFKSRISGVLKGLLLFSSPTSPACYPSPRVPARITAGSISSSSKSMAVPRGGNSIFPFPIKMEEQLLAYEQRYPSCCFPSNTALSPPPSLQQQPALNYSRQSREVSPWNSLKHRLQENAGHEQPKGG